MALRADSRHHFHHAGKTEITSNSVFFLGWRWFAAFPLDSLFVPDYPDREYDLNLSVKGGPVFGGESKDNRGSSDRLRLVAP